MSAKSVIIITTVAVLRIIPTLPTFPTLTKAIKVAIATINPIKLLPSNGRATKEHCKRCKNYGGNPNTHNTDDCNPDGTKKADRDTSK
jgi:hypothetical protein